MSFNTISVFLLLSFNSMRYLPFLSNYLSNFAISKYINHFSVHSYHMYPRIVRKTYVITLYLMVTHTT